MDPKINIMTFKRTQHPETLEILSHHINDREVQPSEYSNTEFDCYQKGMQYCNSGTTRNKKGEFVHTFNYN